MKEDFNYYRVKTEWVAENNDGGISKRKTEELVLAANYTEAEKVAYLIAESQERCKLESSITIDIVKTKIKEMLYNSTLQHDNVMIGGLVHNYFEESDDTGVGLYSVKVVYFEVDEKTGKERHPNETIYTPATSATDAIDFVKKYLNDVETRDFIVRDAKFDKAEAILWSADTQEQKSNQFDKYE